MIIPNGGTKNKNRRWFETLAIFSLHFSHQFLEIQIIEIQKKYPYIENRTHYRLKII